MLLKMRNFLSVQSGSVNRKPKMSEENFKREFTEAMNAQHSVVIRKGKRFRSAFTTEQVNYLENEFKKFPYIGTAHRKEVANALNIHERAVKIWFQNRRMKEKKDSGAKDTDNDDQISPKNVGFVNDKLNNVLAGPSFNEPCYSLTPLNVPTQHNLSNFNVQKDNKNIESFAKVTENIKLNYYNDVSPVREMADITKVTYSNFTTPTLPKNLHEDYRTSAEFSIDLCKKYKSNLPSNLSAAVEMQTANNNNLGVLDLQTIKNNEINNVSPPPHQLQHTYPQEGPPSHDSQNLPEDLSCRSNVRVEREPSSSKNIDSTTPGYIPLYVNYPQPYLSAGNMLWKPVNVLPVMSTGVSAVNISSNQSGSLSVSQEQNLTKKKCNCDCHVETPPALPLTPTLPLAPTLPIPDNNINPQAQYVLTLPFQNYPKF